MSVNAMTEEYEHIELFGKPALFTNARVDTHTVPDGWHVYDLRGSDNDPGSPCTLEILVVVNHAGSIVVPEPISFPDNQDYREIGDALDFLGDEITLTEFCKQYGLKTPPKYKLRPASREEAGLFYSQVEEERDLQAGTVGHVRMDFGSSGKGFHHSWWPHNEDQFNTGEFKDDLQEVVDALRADGPLKDLSAMSTYCHQNGGAITQDGRSYGYIAETKHYRYCLRCTPSPGDYQGYLYCYDLRQQQMAHQNKPVGRVTFASGEQTEYLDGETYLTAIREELPYMATTGFRCETLTDDPAIRKAVDDILLDFAGEANPRRECSYGLTEKGMKALRDAADPSLPHSYSWFVITDCNTQAEQFHRDLTLPDAIRIYSSSDRPEKRIGVTKDGIATVDLVHAQDGEQRFFEDYQKMNSFQNDPEILAAVDCLRQELELPSQGMSMGGM